MSLKFYEEYQQGKKTQWTLIVTHSLGENCWIHTLIQMWNANSFLNDLNSSREMPVV